MFNSEKIIRSAGGIEFTVKYSGRRSMGISISPYSGIVARVPYNTSDRKIEEMILKKHDWIIKILKQHQTLIRLDPEEFVNGAWVIYRGKKHTTAR
jgi:predicted metal-dependent hydrolase